MERSRDLFEMPSHQLLFNRISSQSDVQFLRYEQHNNGVTSSRLTSAKHTNVLVIQHLKFKKKVDHRNETGLHFHSHRFICLIVGQRTKKMKWKTCFFRLFTETQSTGCWYAYICECEWMACARRRKTFFAIHFNSRLRTHIRFSTFKTHTKPCNTTNHWFLVCLLHSSLPQI